MWVSLTRFIIMVFGAYYVTRKWLYPILKWVFSGTKEKRMEDLKDKLKEEFCLGCKGKGCTNCEKIDNFFKEFGGKQC